jgi:mono/diheme cytochrome c family protein
MLIVDMYRGIIEEYHFITSYLRDQSLARGLEKPMLGLGRIWKITYAAGPLEDRQPNLDRMNSRDLVALLAHPDGWWRDTAQQELVEREDWSAIPALEDMAAKNLDPIARLNALWTLDGLGSHKAELLRRALHDVSPKVRAAAIRLHETWLRGSDADSAVRQLEDVMRDPEPEVRVQLTLSLGEARTPASFEAMYQLLLHSENSPDLPSALETGLSGREHDFLEKLEADCRRLQPRPELTAMLGSLATAILHRADGSQVAALIVAVGDQGGLPKWTRTALMHGFDPLLTPAFRRSIGPIRLVRSEALNPLKASSDLDIRGAAERVAEGLSSAEQAQREKPAPVILTKAQTEEYEKGRLTFQICAGCHDTAGSGVWHVAPSLVDSHWVSNYPEIAIRIVLCGKEGTPGFPGPMPPIGGAFNDEQIADVLTYVRNSWGLHLGSVDVDTVARVRSKVGNRQTPWTDAELRRVQSAVAAEKAHAAERTH